MVRLKDQIKNLLELQDVDNHLTALVQEKEEAPKRIAELEARQAKQEGLLAAAKAEQAELNGRRLDLERKIEENTRNTRRSQNKANEVKNTRQHKAILKELEDLKLLKDECENALLEVLGSQEAINPKVEEIGRALEETVKGLAQEKAELMGKMDQMEADIDRLRRQRQGFAQNLPPDVLGHYDFIRSHLKDAAVAPVMDGTCQICHMSLPPQQFIELRRCEELMNCPHCQRIIYWVGYNEP